MLQQRTRRWPSRDPAKITNVPERVNETAKIGLRYNYKGISLEEKNVQFSRMIRIISELIDGWIRLIDRGNDLF